MLKEISHQEDYEFDLSREKNFYNANGSYRWLLPDLVSESKNKTFQFRRDSKNHFAKNSETFSSKRCDEKFNISLNSIRNHNPDCTCFPHFELESDGIFVEARERVIPSARAAL